jgi:hypothetical protein
MDLAPDGFGADKLDDNNGRATNGFTFPRDADLPPREDLGSDGAAYRSRRGSMSGGNPIELPPAGVPVATPPANPMGSGAPTMPPTMPPAGGAAPSTAATLPPVPAALPAPEHDWFRDRPNSPADHPLMRGLLLELPPRGGQLDPAWLEQWLEAARATLGLIYAQRGQAPR